MVFTCSVYGPESPWRGPVTLMKYVPAAKLLRTTAWRVYGREVTVVSVDNRAPVVVDQLENRNGNGPGSPDQYVAIFQQSKSVKIGVIEISSTKASVELSGSTLMALDRERVSTMALTSRMYSPVASSLLETLT